MWGTLCEIKSLGWGGGRSKINVLQGESWSCVQWSWESPLNLCNSVEVMENNGNNAVTAVSLPCVTLCTCFNNPCTPRWRDSRALMAYVRDCQFSDVGWVDPAGPEWQKCAEDTLANKGGETKRYAAVLQRLNGALHPEGPLNISRVCFVPDMAWWHFDRSLKQASPARGMSAYNLLSRQSQYKLSRLCLCPFPLSLYPKSPACRKQFKGNRERERERGREREAQGR